jgi:Family of unknown function (DUF6209)
MTRRLFSNDPPRIVFSRDFRVVVHGDLLPGRIAKVLYDAARLPSDRALERGSKAGTVKAFYKFVEQGPVHEIDLQKEIGATQTKMSHDTAEGTILVCRIAIPQGVDHVTLWFRKTDPSGAQSWDSDYGKNYIFRFMIEDFDIDSVEVAPDPAKPMAWFRVQATAAPDISDLGVFYQVMNQPAGPHLRAPHPQEFLALLPESPPDVSGKRKWSGAAPVPQNAVIKLTFSYHAWGNVHTDTNSGHGYLTWPGARKDPQAGVL